MLLCIILIIKNRTITINLDNYITDQPFAGFNEYGEFDDSVALDTTLITDVLNALAAKGFIDKTALSGLIIPDDNFSVALTQLGFSNPSLSPYLEDILFPLYISADKAVNLKNGDEVRISFSYDNERLKKYKIKFKGKGRTITVDNLTVVPTFDPFEDVKILFSGAEPYGEIAITAPSADKYGITYTADKAIYLSNGDEVTVTVSPQPWNNANVQFGRDYIELYGVLPSATEKTYTVEELPSYLISADELPPDLIEKMETAADNTIRKKTATLDKGESITSFIYQGAYYLKEKATGLADFANSYVLVYKMHVVIDDKYSFLNMTLDVNCQDSFDFYYYVAFYDILRQPDGSYDVNLDEATTPEIYYVRTVKNQGDWGGDYDYAFHGCETLSGIKNEIVIKNADSCEATEIFPDASTPSSENESAPSQTDSEESFKAEENEESSDSKLSSVLDISYKISTRESGWLNEASNGASAASSDGSNQAIEAITISLNNQSDLSIIYKSHIQINGWEEDWKKNGDISGTTGEGKRLEAIQISLEGEKASNYDIYYCVKAPSYGWLDWAKNGEKAGTEGFHEPLTDIKVIVQEAGASKPAPLGNPSAAYMYNPNPD